MIKSLAPACWQKPKSWWYHQNNDFIIHIFISNKQDKHISSGGFIIMCTHHPSNWLSRLATAFLTRPHTAGLICSKSCDTLSHLCFGVFWCAIMTSVKLMSHLVPKDKGKSLIHSAHSQKTHMHSRDIFSKETRRHCQKYRWENNAQYRNKAKLILWNIRSNFPELPLSNSDISR